MSIIKLSMSGLLAVLTGCVQTKFTTTPGGKSTFTTTRFLWNGKIQTAEIQTNGTAKIVGYTSDAAAIAGAVAEGVAKGLK